MYPLGVLFNNFIEMASNNGAIPATMWMSIFAVTIQSFLFGYVFVSLNPCLVTGSGNSGQACFNGDDDSDVKCPPGSIYNDLDLDVVETSLAVTLMLVGAWLGSTVCSYPLEKFGRKSTLVANSLTFIVGAVLSGSGNFYAFFIGRVISGLGVGFMSVIGPMLLSEVSAPATRGVVTTMHQVMVVLGIFAAGVIAFGLVSNFDHGWEYVQYFPAGPAAIVFLVRGYIPESPKWLLMQGRETEARAQLFRLRPLGYNIEDELEEIRSSTIVTEEIGSWSEVFESTGVVVAGCGLMSLYALTGINSVSFYSTTIFGFAGFSNSLLATVLVNSINFLSTCAAAFLVDKFRSRKTLLIAGLWVMALALTLLSTVLFAGDKLGDSVQGAISVAAVLFFVAGFALGMGSIVWVMMAEFTPNKIRAKAMSLFLNVNWASNIVIGMSTLPAINGLGNVRGNQNGDDDKILQEQKDGVAFLFFIFLGMTLFCIVFVHNFVPDTRGHAHIHKMPSKQLSTSGYTSPLVTPILEFRSSFSSTH